MDIEERLRDDASRVAGIQPPAELSSRLRASLEGAEAPAGPGVRRWFKPAMAMLTAAMLAVALLPGESLVPVFDGKASQEASLTDDHRGQADPEAPFTKNNDYAGKQPNDSHSAPEQTTGGEIIATAPRENPPWGRVGVFSGLAALTGGLWIYEFGRRRLALALIIPVLTLVLGNLWLLRNLLF